MVSPDLHWKIFGVCKLQKFQGAAGSVVLYCDCHTNAVL